MTALLGLLWIQLEMRLRELRQTLVSCRHATEGFRGLVVILSEQVINNSIILIHTDDTAPCRDSLNLESSQREQEIVRKGIEQVKKQIRQLTQNAMDTEPVDIELIKKFKTV